LYFLLILDKMGDRSGLLLGHKAVIGSDGVEISKTLIEKELSSYLYFSKTSIYFSIKCTFTDVPVTHQADSFTPKPSQMLTFELSAKTSFFFYSKRVFKFLFVVTDFHRLKKHKAVDNGYFFF